MPGVASQVLGLALCSLIGASPLYGAEEASNSSLRLPISEATDRVFVPMSAGPAMAHVWVGQIADDNQGFLWFATRDGLLRYDGYQVRPYYPYSNGVRGSGKFEECCPTVSLVPGMSRYSLLNDGSGKIWRFAHHRSVYQTVDFWSTPRGNVSQDGKFYEFTSTWGNELGIQPGTSGIFRKDVFVVELH